MYEDIENLEEKYSQEVEEFDNLKAKLLSAHRAMMRTERLLKAFDQPKGYIKCAHRLVY